jgi:AraC-like DNA-binding protein
MTANYTKRAFRQVININRIISLHYFEYGKDYVFNGEAHDFWEIAYADKGELLIECDSGGVILKKGELIFHKPNEFHTVKATGGKAFNLLVISFDTSSPAIHFFENRIIKINNNARTLLSRLLSEGRSAYMGPLDAYDQKKLIRSPDCPFGAEQMIKLSLEALLIEFIRELPSPPKKTSLTYSTRETAANAAVEKICRYMESNYTKDITIGDLCRRFNMGQTCLKQVFREVTGKPPIRYLTELRLSEAKKLIREEQYNFTQIAELVGYNSVHYFSRSFRKNTGMTPSEYAVSVKAHARL